MATFGELIDRTYREYLRPVEEQEPLSQVANTDTLTDGVSQGITSSGTTLQYRSGLFTPEEEKDLPEHERACVWQCGKYL